MDTEPARASPTMDATGTGGDNAAAARSAGAVAVFSLCAHLLGHAWFVAHGHVFACEDDPYRLYNSYLLAQDGARAVGAFWLPGQFFALAALSRAGVPAVWSGPLLGALSVAVLALALRSLCRSLAPARWAGAAGNVALVLVFASPMTFVLSHSALAETQAGALLVACAALAVRARARGSLRALAGASLALLLATWLRYECWAFVPVFMVYAQRFGVNGRRRAGLALGLVPALGPLAWVLLQWSVRGDPLGFLRQSQLISESLLGPASPARVLADRVQALLVWCLPTIVWCVLGAALLRRSGDRATLRATTVLAAVAALPALAEVLTGHEHPVFPARFAYEIELGLLPLAALGAARALDGARPRMTTLALGATVFALAAGVFEPPAMQDESSVRLGLALRDHALDRELRGGTLLVERPVKRPPFGWASVGVLWEHWDRVVWATPSARGFVFVEPTDVRARGPAVPAGELRAWLDRRGVTAAWLTSDEAMRAVRAAWPGASVRDDGEHALYVRNPE